MCNRRNKQYTNELTVIVWSITVPRMCVGTEGAESIDKTIHPTKRGTGYSSYAEDNPARQSFHKTMQSNHRNTFGKEFPRFR